MTALNSEGLEKAVAQAIFDPGATEGYKGDRTLTEWQVQAVMRAITSHTPALPPVDGLEVVAWDVAPKGLPAEPTKSHSFVAEIERQGGSITPLVTLYQASSVIAGLTKERDEARESLRTVQNAAKTLATCRDTELEHLRQNANYDHLLRAQHESLMDRDAQMTDALIDAEARISSLEEENKRLVALIEEKGSASLIRAARKALGDHNG